MTALSRSSARNKDASYTPKSHKRNVWQRIWQHKIIYLMLVPTFAMLALFAYYPAGKAMYGSLLRWNGVNVSEFIGFGNFSTLLSVRVVPVQPKIDEATGEFLRDDDGNLEYLSARRVIRNNDTLDGYQPLREVFVGNTRYDIVARDPVFIKSLGNMLILLVADVLKSLLVPLLLANLIFHLWSERSKYIFRILLILPAVVPAVVTALLWKDFYRMPTQGSHFAGLINQLLALIDPALQHGWLGDTATVLPALIFHGFPWVNGANTLILLAGLIAIPHEIYDAAHVDGAKAWTIFRKIELPLLRGPVRLVLIFALLGSIQNYSGILIMTAGGPSNASMVPGLWLYNNAFQFNRYGYASAIGVILFVMLLSLTILSQRLLRSDAEA